MTTKRKPDSQVPAEESDLLLIRPLYVNCVILFRLVFTQIPIFSKHSILTFFSRCRGAGQEVGRSCIMLEFKGKKIMVCI